jgi:hypothetical protein
LRKSLCRLIKGASFPVFRPEPGIERRKAGAWVIFRDFNDIGLRIWANLGRPRAVVYLFVLFN